jgi:hypothetical protein
MQYSRGGDSGQSSFKEAALRWICSRDVTHVSTTIRVDRAAAITVRPA